MTATLPPSLRIEDYAIIGNCKSAALVGSNGSIDWLCLPRFDSGACFAALLGTEDNGRWLVAPKHPTPTVKRRYQDATLVLETEFSTPEGKCVLIDCMDRDGDTGQVLRLVRGLAGSVDMRMDLKIRFEYGSIVPWVTRLPDGRVRAVAGPDQMVVAATTEMHGEDLTTRAEFTVREGEEVSFSMSWNESHLPVPAAPDACRCIERIAAWWRNWANQHTPHGPYHEAVLRSIITLKALTHYETGGIVAAATTSLPEALGGHRNWDYRFCWLRDATFTLFALLNSGFTDEAKYWRNWLLRAVAGSPDQMQIMYGVAGERRLAEYEIPWLSGYENSKPVRIGNAASEQVQLDVFGEVLDLLYQARTAGLASIEDGWAVERALVSHLARIWEEPDAGIWEIRGPARQFTHSKVMAWVAVDRGLRTAEEFGAQCPIHEWRALRARIHAEICEKGFNSQLNSFVQYFGGDSLDASLLMLPLVGFLPPHDPRILGTVAAIEKSLLRDGFVQRYDTASPTDGVGGADGAFLACSFWLADNYVLQGRHEEATRLFNRLLQLRNDVGLFSEEYDISNRRLVGNFPQAFSHVAMVNTAHRLAGKLHVRIPARRHEPVLTR